MQIRSYFRSRWKKWENLRQIIYNSNKKGQIYNNLSIMRLIRAERKAACDGFTRCRVQTRSLRVRTQYGGRAAANFCRLGLVAERVLKSCFFFLIARLLGFFLLEFNVSYVSQGILNGDVCCFFFLIPVRLFSNPFLTEVLLSFLDEKGQKNARIFSVKKEGF